MNRLFITATGTSSGKTFVARSLAVYLRRAGIRVGAIKPLETGCEPDALDAIKLARACGHPELAEDAAFYRVKPPLSPYAATLSGATTPDLPGILARVRALSEEYPWLLIEGAGGLLVPLDRERDMADLAAALACPLVIVAPNQLGVLSHVRAVAEAAENRSLVVAAVVLTDVDSTPDQSTETNLQILRERLSIPVVGFPNCSDDDEVLGDAAEVSGLVEVLFAPVGEARA
jgi:dethiobiotin synthetase